jgi:hypothetical protein
MNGMKKKSDTNFSLVITSQIIVYGTNNLELLLHMHLLCHYEIFHYALSQELHLEPAQELLPVLFSTQINLQMFLPVLRIAGAFINLLKEH